MKTTLFLIGVAGVAVFIVWPRVIDRGEEILLEVDHWPLVSDYSGVDRVVEKDELFEEFSDENKDKSDQWKEEAVVAESDEGGGGGGEEKQQTDVTGSIAPGPIVPEESGLVTGVELLLAVPFVSQAPYGNWNQPYQDACEEAAVIMVERFLRGKDLTVAEMDEEILKMVEWQTEKYGLYKDTNSVETADLAQSYYGLSSQVVYKVEAEDIREVLRDGRPVVVLVDGRKLGNPFYTPPGPERHSLVVIGFKGDEFITNDPGTRRGAAYRYPASKLIDAMVDYDGREAGTGGKAMVIIAP